jgi:hypothetical protein
MLETISFGQAIGTLAPTLIIIAVFFLLILGGFLWMVQSYFEFEKNIRLVDIKLKTQERTLPLQLNAYERVILYLERLNPSNLLMRNYEAGMKARDLQKKVVEEVRSEFEHNLTQQIYISEESWDVLKKVKDETIMLINGQLIHSGEESSGLEFTKQVFEKLGKMEVNPYDYAINLIKKEVQQLF